MEATVNQTAANEVMDARIVKLNEIIGVRLSSISSKKRPAVKEAKELAKYILANWDDESELLKIKSEDVTNETVQGILSSRLQNFIDAKNACKKAVKELEAPKADKEPKATKTSGHKVGDVHKNGKWVWTEYAPGKFDWRTIPSKKQKTGAKPKNTEEKKETKKADKKQDNKKAEKASKGIAKQPKKEEPKKESPEAPKRLTIDEWVALPTKAARSNKKPTEAQKQAFKLIMKGYRITSDKKFFEKDDDRKSCNWESVVALFKRYGIDYIPEGLVK